jgi:hypothetical protein
VISLNYEGHSLSYLKIMTVTRSECVCSDNVTPHFLSTPDQYQLSGSTVCWVITHSIQFYLSVPWM